MIGEDIIENLRIIYVILLKIKEFFNFEVCGEVYMLCCLFIYLNNEKE